jgi:hypothetical protein
MKVWVLAGLFTVATAPMAFAAEDATECQLDDARRATQQQTEQPAPTIGRPTVAERDVTVVPGAALPARAPAERRRNGKRIPDAQLIGPRGAL